MINLLQPLKIVVAHLKGFLFTQRIAKANRWST